MSSLQEEREACAKLLELSMSDILSLAGEMTAQEMRTVRAVLYNRAKAIRNRGDQVTASTEVHKFSLPFSTGHLLLPVGAVILSVQEQYGNVCLCVKVDPKETRIEKRTFHLFSPSSTTPAYLSLNHVGTVQINGGSHDVCVYEETGEDLP